MNNGQLSLNVFFGHILKENIKKKELTYFEPPFSLYLLPYGYNAQINML